MPRAALLASLSFLLFVLPAVAQSPREAPRSIIPLLERLICRYGFGFQPPG